MDTTLYFNFHGTINYATVILLELVWCELKTNVSRVRDSVKRLNQLFFKPNLCRYIQAIFFKNRVLWGDIIKSLGFGFWKCLLFFAPFYPKQRPMTVLIMQGPSRNRFLMIDGLFSGLKHIKHFPNQDTSEDPTLMAFLFLPGKYLHFD